MSKVKIFTLWMKGIGYAIKLLFVPKDILTLLKLGDLLTETKSFSLFLERVKTSPETHALINARYSKLPLAQNWWMEYPEGTLGWAYHQHLQKNNLQMYPLTISKDCSESIYLRERQREIHDILHAAFGLGVDIADEARLNAILIAQGGAPISVLIVAGSLLHCLFKTPEQILKLTSAITDGYNYGQKIRSVYSLKWEELMGLPLSEVHGILENV